MSIIIVRILALLGILTTCQNSDVSVRLSNNPYPVYYNVELDLTKIEKGFYSGVCYIGLKFRRPTDSIRFHTQQHIQIKTDSIVLSKVLVTLHPAYLTRYTYTSAVYKPTRHKYEGNHTLTIYFNYMFSDGEIYPIWVLTIPFNTSLPNDGDGLLKISYINEEGSGIWALGMFGARRIFPCWDDPGFKATFNFTIKHLSKHTVLSIMPVQMNKTSKGLTTTHFTKTLYDIPSYLVAIVVSNFSHYSARINKKINLQCRPQAALYLRYAKRVIENVTLHFESQWKRCKVLAKVDHIAIPRFTQEGMLGLIFYREEALIYDEQLDPIIRKVDVARLVAREVAHQCLNNLVRFSLWSQWLKEQLLTLHAADALNKIYPDFRILELFVVQIQQESLRLDTNSIMNSIMSEANSIKINSSLPFSSYIKAPAILRMLQHVLGYEIFWNGIEIFLRNQKYNWSPNWDNFWAAMQIALDNSHNIKFNVRSMMRPWIMLEHYPVLNVQQYNVSQVRISIKNKLDQTVEIPVTFTTQDYYNFNNTSPYYQIFFSPYGDVGTPILISTSDVFLPNSNSHGWVIINIQQAGYYRVNYDAIYWDRIVNYLNTSNEYTKIHVLNRAQIIDDAFYFLMNDQLSLSIFLNLTKYLQRETDYVAWYPMIKALEYMSGFFLFEESAKLKIHMRDILHELLESIRYAEKLDEKPNDLIKCLRLEAAKWACVLGDSMCKFEATYKLTRHLDDIETLSPEWKNWMYCNGLGPYSNVWWNVFDTWVNKTDNKLLEYLSCSTSPGIIQIYLNIIANKSENCSSEIIDCMNVTMQPKDRVNSFLITVAKHTKDNAIFKYILQNFKEDKTMVPRKVGDIDRAVLIIIINRAQSKEQLDEVLEFVKDKRKQIIKEVNNIINLSQDASFQKNMREALKVFHRFKWRDYWNTTFLGAEQKIKARLSEIRSQLNYFQNLRINGL